MIKIKIWGLIDSETSNVVETAVTSLKDSKEPVLIVLNSPGGFINDGYTILNLLEKLPNPIYTVNIGLCESLACAIFALGKKRYIGDNSVYLVHQPFILEQFEVNHSEAKELSDKLKIDLDWYSNKVLKDCVIPKTKLDVFLKKGEDLTLTVKECLKYKVATDKYTTYDAIKEDMNLPVDEETLIFESIHLD